MGGRAKPNWAVFVGGPLDGTRSVLHPAQSEGPLIVPMPSETPGMVVPHEYAVTSEKRKGGFHESACRVVTYLHTLPAEPAPRLPPAPSTPGGSHG